VSVQEIAILNEALENAESEIGRLRGEYEISHRRRIHALAEIERLRGALDNAQDEIVLRDLTIKRLRDGIEATIGEGPRVDNDGVAHVAPWRLRLAVLLDGRENDPRCRP
jgi:hypothetical protein